MSHLSKFGSVCPTWGQIAPSTIKEESTLEILTFQCRLNSLVTFIKFKFVLKSLLYQDVPSTPQFCFVISEPLKLILRSFLHGMVHRQLTN